MALSLSWDDAAALQEFAATPDDVLTRRRGKFQFRTDEPAAGVEGLRPPQVGALHAIAAHFAMGETFDFATVVLPTGTGKTETSRAQSPADGAGKDQGES